MRSKRKKIKLIKSILIFLLFFLIGIGVTYVLIRKNDMDNNKKGNKLDSTQLAVQINAVVNFKDGESDGDLFIMNPNNNIYNVVVKIYLEDNKNLIYESKKLKPGESIEYDKLKTDLSAGKYNATAYFEAYDKDNLFYGKTGIKIVLKVNG